YDLLHSLFLLVFRGPGAGNTRPVALMSHAPSCSSSRPARSPAFRRAVGLRGAGGGEAVFGSAAAVSAPTNRAMAGREVTQRPPTRAASSFTVRPSGVRIPLVTQRSTVLGATDSPPRCPGNSR